jgi:predicted PurR-regulated permease PerM
MSEYSLDLTSITLKVLFIVGLLVASFWVVQSFLPAVVWAMTLVIATWPLMLSVQSRLGGRRSAAVFVMITALLLVVIVPFWLAVTTVLTNLDQIGELANTLLTMRVPAPPDWLASVPLVGVYLADMWGKLSNSGVGDFAPKVVPYVGSLTQWFAATAGSLGGMFIHFLLTALIAAVMYIYGESAAATAIQFGRRLGADRGEMAVRLAGQAIRSVALGVVVTAVAQTVISGIGLAVVGTPFAAVLTALILVLCLIQLGPGLVLIPAVIWMYYSNDVLWATVLLGFTIVATTIDQFIRPILIRRGADLPLLLILGGVIGGLIAFGILGMFIGPTVLAVTYTLLNAWLADIREPAPLVAKAADPRRHSGQDRLRQPGR